MLDDALLIWRFKRGRVDALRQIYDRYKADLLKLAVSLTGDVGLSEDVVQDVFVRLAESRDKIGIRGSLRNYLFTCTLNRIRSLRRHDQCCRQVSLDADEEIAGSPGPEHWAILNEQMRHLQAALAQLPLEQREAVALRFEGGLGFRQIARIQGTSVHTSHGRYRYGIEKLRYLLNVEVSR
jgi:RNA polymerase sigma-70 factor (ECF subfamily)